MRLPATVIFSLLSALAFAQQPDDPLSYFLDNEHWQRVGTVAVDGATLRWTREEENRIAINGEHWSESGHLETREHFGDSILRMEFMLPEGSSAGVYLQGRYEVTLADSHGQETPGYDTMGALAQRWQDGREPSGFDGRAPLSNAALPAGQWQTLEVEFRAPRYDDANNKVDNALLLSVIINGERVQYKTIATGFTRDSLFPWEQDTGPMMIRGNRGPIAIRSFDVRRADFSQVQVPEESGQATNREQLVDFVAQGEALYRGLGCASCHSTVEGDPSVRTGSNLFGLFTQPPRDREIAVGADGDRFTVRADRSYLHRSIRDPDSELAIAESGGRRGQAYPAIMPTYGEDMLSDNQIDAIGAYLLTLNHLPQQGPVVRLVEEGGPEQYDPLLDGLQFLVTDRTRIQRGPMPGMSGRAIHVGLPNGINYSFDPRVLGLVRVWQGGFLYMRGELTNRGGSGLRTGFETREIDLDGAETLFAPLNSAGEMIDFSFKEPKFQDNATIEHYLYSEIDHLERLQQVNAAFLGYRLDTRRHDAAPAFQYRVGQNRLAVRSDFAADGQVTIQVSGSLAETQRFVVNDRVLRDIQVSAGEIRDGIWELPAEATAVASLQARIRVVSDPWRPEPKAFEYQRQPLKTLASSANLPAGYSIEDYLPPRDNYGRDQLFEALGLAVAPDGTLVVATRTAGVWRLVDGHWQLFAEGLFDILGVEVEDERGLSLVVSQKAELTRLSDTNGDGRADTFETLFDAHGFHSNYHTYMHGPARGGDGAYYVAINLAHADEAIYKADGMYMGSQGGLSGWAFRITPNGDYELFARGLRSPAGIATAPDGRVWFADNQGEFVGTSKLYVLERDRFYGHPSGLIDLPGMTPDSPEIAWEAVADTREKEVVLFAQNLVANSPGHPIWDTTEGKFGPFAGQIFIGDQTLSNLMRVTTEKVAGLEQGAVIPFADGLASGAMRPVFLPDGSLLMGQTGRGWQSRGGHVASLQRIIWDGETVMPALLKVTATPGGFDLHLTHALQISSDEVEQRLSVRSWTYRDAPDYGSDMLGQRDEALAGVSVSADRKVIRLQLADSSIPDVHPHQVGRQYHLRLDTRDLFAEPGPEQLEAYYTLYRFPESE